MMQTGVTSIGMLFDGEEDEVQGWTFVLMILAFEPGHELLYSHSMNAKFS